MATSFRKVVCNAIAFELSEQVANNGMDVAYSRFQNKSAKEALNAREQMYVVFRAGAIRGKFEQELTKDEGK